MPTTEPFETHRHDERITLREEDRVMAYYASGNLYRTPDRREPLL